MTSTCASSAIRWPTAARSVVVDHLHGVLRQSGVAQPFVHAGGDRLVAANRFRAAAQDRRVAGLEAQPGGVRGDVGPRLVDDADHAERHAHHADLDAGRAILEIGDLADGIGQRRDLARARAPSRRSSERSSVSRSTNAASWPLLRAAATSCAFAASSASASRRIAAAMRCNAKFLHAFDARATIRDAGVQLRRRVACMRRRRWWAPGRVCGGRSRLRF